MAKINKKDLKIFVKKSQKLLSVQKKLLPLQPQNGNGSVFCNSFLGYGVMVTLQILVLSFLVRVRVPQQKSSSVDEDFFVLCRK